VLTRREILKYITAEAGTRAQEIQTILNISEIASIRRALVRVNRDFERALDTAKANLEGAKSDVIATMGEKKFSEQVVLQNVNKNRTILGGQRIQSINSEGLKSGINPLASTPSGQIANIDIFSRDIENIKGINSDETKNTVAKNDKELRNTLEEIRSKPELRLALVQKQLIEQGLELIDESGNCPLCDTEWPEGALKKYLEDKFSNATIAEKHEQRIKNNTHVLKGYIDTIISSLNRVIAVIEKIENLKDARLSLNEWLLQLRHFWSLLDKPLEKYPDSKYDLNSVKNLLRQDDFDKLLDHLYEEVEAKCPKSSPEQTAWDTLTRLEENLRLFEKSKTIVDTTKLSHLRSSVLLETFESARNFVLGKLYEKIKGRFVELYRHLHGSDENQFTAELKPVGAGLDFEVDFYGRGKHPPHALHSEGHQDSMGLCLYLALSEELTKGLIDIVILDDVVMSVDSNHRRSLCSLLKNNFGDRQFIITTHDRTWTNQLKSEGFISSKQCVEFYNWRVETGPQVNHEVDMWERIEHDLLKNDVPNAAFRLRRGSEEYFSLVCDSLRAFVPFKMDGRNELNELLSGGIGQYNKLLKLAKKASQSWGDETILDLCKELESTSSQIFTRVGGNQWAVNTNVHYNNWANFSVNDFRPVLEAFQDLYGIFRCSRCSDILRLIISGVQKEAVRCNCGAVNWNLVEKPKNKESVVVG
ncbi:MAG: AAA family ATPase, partial [bacterium]